MKLFPKISIALSLFLLAGAGASFAIANDYEKPYGDVHATYTNGDADTYYNSIDDSLAGNDLLKALRTLNLNKRKSTVGYSSMGTSPSGQFKYTDYDPDTVQYDSNGQPYGTKISSFYTYTSATSWNREHVWPNSHGGGSKGDAGSPYPDADIHMPRPTISSENSSRGNSFFVEGMNSSSGGWDPKTAGYSAESRGEAVRITFYCMTVNAKLCLAPSNTTPSGTDPVTGLSYGSGHTMGNLETLLKWNIDYPVNQRERNRNEGAEYLQGNRNAFIDHPEYACKIWGDVNSTTRSICGASQTAPTSLTMTPSSASIAVGGKVTLTAKPNSGSNLVNWSTSNSSVATVSGGVVTGVSAGTATITATSQLNSSVKCTATITVKTISSLTKIGEPTKTTYGAGDNFDPAGLTITAKYSDNSTANVTNNVTWSPSPLTAGTTSVTGTYAGKSVTVSGLTVEEVAEKSISYTDLDTSYPSSAKDYTSASGIKFKAMNCANFSSSMQFKKSGGYLYNTESLNLSSITLNSTSGTLTVYAGTSANPSSVAITASNGKYDLSGYNYFKIINSSSSVAKCSSIDIEFDSGSATPSALLTSIAVTNYSQNYTVGDTFSFDGTCTAYYSDGSESDVTPTSVTSPNMSTSGNKTITVSYTEGTITKTAQYVIYVAPAATLLNISISGTLQKDSYYTGETFDPTGLTVSATYSDDSVKDITSSVSWSPNPLTKGTTTVTATFEGKTDTISGLTVVDPTLTSITTSGQTTEFDVGDEFSYTGTCTAHYSNNTSKVVTPTVNSSSVNMAKAGIYTITLSYTEGGVSKSTSYSITVVDIEFENTIEQLYSRSAGTLAGNTFYGLYMGYTSHTNKSGTYYDMYIGNGNYAILLYGTTKTKPTYTAFETYLSITGGYLSIYNNLYEVANYVNKTDYPTTITTLSSSQVSAYVAPVTTYNVTGNEDGSTSKDQKTASRLAMISGTVATVSGTISSSNEVTVEITLPTSTTAKVFIKKNADNINYTKLAEKLVVGNEVTVKGFTSVHGSEYELVNPEIVEASTTYLAADFAQDVLDLTNGICASSGNKESLLAGVWMSLETEKWAILATEEKNTLLNASADQYGTVIEQAMARYDQICTKYASCSNFIERGTANYHAQYVLSFENNSSMLIIFISIAVFSASCLGLYFVLKKRKHN